MATTQETTKHTPGPWRFSKSRRGSGGVVDSTISQRRVATIHVGEGATPEQINADASLVTAAPDLLAACKAAASLLLKLGGTNHDPEYSDLLAAIAKAGAP